MPIHKVRESDIPALGYTGRGGTIVKVDVLSDDGKTATISVQDCGIRASWNDRYEVPSSAVHMWHEDL